MDAISQMQRTIPEKSAVKSKGDEEVLSKRWQNLENYVKKKPKKFRNLAKGYADTLKSKDAIFEENEKDEATKEQVS